MCVNKINIFSNYTLFPRYADSSRCLYTVMNISKFDIKIYFSAIFKSRCETACFWEPSKISAQIPYIAVYQRPIIIKKYHYCGMFYDVRTLYWDNFDIWRCTHQAHFEHFSKLIFFYHKKIPRSNLSSRYFVPGVCTSKKFLNGRSISIYLRPGQFWSAGNDFRLT